MSDITCLPLANGTWVVPGWAYLCTFQGVCTKYMVGWQVRADMSEELASSSALQRALRAQRPALGLIVHSERGRTR